MNSYNFANGLQLAALITVALSPVVYFIDAALPHVEATLEGLTGTELQADSEWMLLGGASSFVALAFLKGMISKRNNGYSMLMEYQFTPWK